MKRRTIVISTTLLVVFLFVFLVLSRLSKKRILEKTEVATLHTQAEYVRFPAMAIRDEVIIEGAKNDTVMFLYEDGRKVRNGTDIAVRYESAEDVKNQKQKQVLEEELAMLESASERGVSDQSVINILMLQTQAISEKYERDLGHGTLDGLTAYKNELAKSITMRNIAMGKETDFSKNIEALQARISEVERKMTPSIGQVTAPVSGYFVSSTDGYENFATFDDVLNMNASDLRAIYEEERVHAQNENEIGKMIDGYEWYLAILVPNDRLTEIEEHAGKLAALSNQVTLRFSFETAVDAKAELVSVRPRLNEEETIVIFKTSTMNASLASFRKGEVELVFGDYQGVRFSKESIHFSREMVKDETTGKQTEVSVPGVYIRIGNDIQFRYIDIIYEDETYVISALHASIPELKLYLQPDDIILVNGKEEK